MRRRCGPYFEMKTRCAADGRVLCGESVVVCNGLTIFKERKGHSGLGVRDVRVFEVDLEADGKPAGAVGTAILQTRE